MKKNQEESAVSRSCLDFNHNLFINPVWSLKKLVPVIILIIYSFLGGLIFYLLEKDTECQFDYWTALFYAGTIYTTIGTIFNKCYHDKSLEFCNSWQCLVNASAKGGIRPEAPRMIRNCHREIARKSLSLEFTA